MQTSLTCISSDGDKVTRVGLEVYLRFSSDSPRIGARSKLRFFPYTCMLFVVARGICVSLTKLVFHVLIIKFLHNDAKKSCVGK